MGEGLAQLAAVDRTRAVAVKVPEDVLPVLDVLPEAGKLKQSVSCWSGEDVHRILTSLKPMVPLRSTSNIVMRSLIVSKSKAIY